MIPMSIQILIWFWYGLCRVSVFFGLFLFQAVFRLNFQHASMETSKHITKSCNVCFGPTHVRNLSTSISEAVSTSHQNETQYLDLYNHLSQPFLSHVDFITKCTMLIPTQWTSEHKIISKSYPQVQKQCLEISTLEETWCLICLKCTLFVSNH